MKKVCIFLLMVTSALKRVWFEVRQEVEEEVRRKCEACECEDG